MYDQIRTIIEQDGTYEPVDPKIVQEITSWYESSQGGGVDAVGLSNMLEMSPATIKAEIMGVYAYLASGRAIFGGGR
jgi:hypothetical protein